MPLRFALSLGALAALAGCSAIEFYWQGVAGQLDLLARAQPIPEVVASTLDPVLKMRLERVQEIRAFASRDFPAGQRQFHAVSDLGRPFVVWNVFAAPELSLEAKQWCFPVAGCVAYRGYFAESDAKAETARLAAEGFDVHVSGVPAYSTLGYFDDPVLSTCCFREAELARLIFRLAHQSSTCGDTVFNESFATVVEDAGSYAGSRRTRSRRCGRARADVARMAVARRVPCVGNATRERLVPSMPAMPRGGKRARKAALFVAMRAEHERRKAGSGARRSIAGSLPARTTQALPPSDSMRTVSPSSPRCCWPKAATCRVSTGVYARSRHCPRELAMRRCAKLRRGPRSLLPLPAASRAITTPCRRAPRRTSP
jgi:predicted aminopeptidase